MTRRFSWVVYGRTLCHMVVLAAILPASGCGADSPLVKEWIGKGGWVGQLEFHKDGRAMRRNGFSSQDDGTYRISGENTRAEEVSGRVIINWNHGERFRADPQHECGYTIKGITLTLACEGKTYVYQSYQTPRP